MRKGIPCPSWSQDDEIPGTLASRVHDRVHGKLDEDLDIRDLRSHNGSSCPEQRMF